MSVRQQRSDFCLASVDDSPCGRTAPLVAIIIIIMHVKEIPKVKRHTVRRNLYHKRPCTTYMDVVKGRRSIFQVLILSRAKKPEITRRESLTPIYSIPLFDV